MNNVIESLYYIFSEENNVFKKDDYRKAFDKMSKLIDEIKELLPEEKREMPDELYSAMAKMMLIESKEMFAGGFKVAVEIVSECL